MEAMEPQMEVLEPQIEALEPHDESSTGERLVLKPRVHHLKKTPPTEKHIRLPEHKRHVPEAPQYEFTTRPAEMEKLGWVSPTYHQSRSVTLDPRAIAENRCVAFMSDAPEVEAYRILRTKIMHRIREKGGNTLMVTSALAGEGKTLTAINLALTFAKEFSQTVLLVDCDLRRQKIHDYLKFDSDRGVCDYLLDDCPVSELMVWPGIEKLTLISGGRTISDSSELLGSPRMKELVADLKNRYPDRLVIFDVPPVLATADALAFTPLVDTILVTVREGETAVDDINRALGMLPPDKILGLVLNRTKRPMNSYYPPQKK